MPVTTNVSITIPLHNKAPWIDRAIRSVLDQTATAWELVVVDDGSTDDGPQRVAAWGDHRVRLLRQPQAGPGAARNQGLRESHGERVAFLDADDEWRPTFLERTAAVLDAQPRAVAAFSNLVDALEDRPLLKHVSVRNGLVENYFEAWIANRGFGMSASSTLVRRVPFLECGAFPEDRMHGEDLDAWGRLALTGPVAYVPEPLVVYHRRLPGSLSAQSRDRVSREPPFVSTYRTWARAGRIPPALSRSCRRYAAFQLASLAREQLHGRARAAALRSLGQALLLAPTAAFVLSAYARLPLAGRVRPLLGR